MPVKAGSRDPVLARHRQASHEYQLMETIEAGIELTGTEVKALRAGRAQLREGYVRIENGEAWLLQVHIGQYEGGNRQNHEPERRRRLLLHRREIHYLDAKARLGGFTLVPLRLYLKGNLVKCEVAVARGKKLWDKRQALAERDARREVERATARALSS
ncbi:MAG TPA: SsrA-binding protein SmpB [Candidatus Binatia bacterium]|nr:SsrA-binding protein SmpB [Candidatus Binatia bacterium]